MDLLLRQHTGENFAPLDDAVQQVTIIVPDQCESPAVACEDVVTLLVRALQQDILKVKNTQYFFAFQITSTLVGDSSSIV
jgi:hypothetical protein